MSKYLIIKNTGIYTIVLIMPQITGFLLLPIYTRFLTPADYAILAVKHGIMHIQIPSDLLGQIKPKILQKLAIGFGLFCFMIII